MPVYREPAGNWFVTWRDVDHKQHKKRGFTRKRDAEEFLAQVITDTARGDYVPPTAGKVKFGTLGEKYLATRTGLKPSTAITERQAWEKHVKPRWEKRNLDAIQPSDISQWIAELSQSGLGASATLRAHGILSAVLDFAVADRLLNKNPARGLKNLPRKTKRPHVYLTHQEVDHLAEASGQYGTIVRVLSYTGLRWGELAALKVKSLDPKRGRISVTENAVDAGGYVVVGTPKTHEFRTMVVPAFLLEPLLELCEDKSPEDLLFPAPTGGYMRRPNVNRPKKGWFITAKELSGVPERLTIHDLRHTAASLAVSSGANVKVVQKMLGHKSAAMTLDTYAELFDTDLESVAERLNQARSQEIVANLLPIERHLRKRMS